MYVPPNPQIDKLRAKLDALIECERVALETLETLPKEIAVLYEPALTTLMDLIKERFKDLNTLEGK
jgi:hypothetical protein